MHSDHCNWTDYDKHLFSCELDYSNCPICSKDEPAPPFTEIGINFTSDNRAVCIKCPSRTVTVYYRESKPSWVECPKCGYTGTYYEFSKFKERRTVLKIKACLLGFVLVITLFAIHSISVSAGNVIK